MIFNFTDNIFDYYPEALTHPVSCLGLAHSMLSRKIKQIWPDYFREYSRACLRKHLKPYHAYNYEINTLFGTNHIITITIRNNWQETLKQDTMQTTIESLIRLCQEQKISTLAIPIIDSIPHEWMKNEIELISKKYEKNSLNLIYFFKNS